MAGNQYGAPGIRGAFNSVYSNIGVGRGNPGDLLSAIAGTNASGPNAYIPESELARQKGWFYRSNPLGLVTDASTTDGNNEWFQTLTNSGAATLLATQASYEGLVLSTTGASSGNQNTYIATPSFKSVAGLCSFMSMRFWAKDPNAAAYSFVFGFGNKQADPIGTAFTDGMWIQGTTSAGVIAFVGKTRTASGTASTTATLGTIASGVARSVELGIISFGQSTTTFATRSPGVSSNLWVPIATVLTPPAATVLLRPHFAHYTNTAAAHAFNCETPIYAFQRPVTY